MASTSYPAPVSSSRDDPPRFTVRDLVESLEGLIATYRRWDDDGPCEGFRDVSYGDFEPARSWEDEPDSELYFLPDLLSGSDYSGCSVTRTNFEEFSKMAEEKGLTGVWEAHGGHGTYALVIRFDVADEEFLESLGALSDYPVIDDEALTRKEMELQDEAWRDCYEKDYVRALEKARSIEFDRYDADTLREVLGIRADTRGPERILDDRNRMLGIRRRREDRGRDRHHGAPADTVDRRRSHGGRPEASPVPLVLARDGLREPRQ